MGNFPHLFSPAYIGNLLIKNRIVMAPMLVAYGTPDGCVSDTVLDYYEARARGGAGLIIVEAACVDALAGRDNFLQLNIDHPRYIAGLECLSRNIKAYGCRAFIQLMHAGRQTSGSVTGVQPVAPSPLACPMIKEKPRQLGMEEIREIENKFIRAAQYAGMAGFDGVELHAAHGYLINQFLSPHTNQRDDEYGRSLENRMRLLINIVSNIKASCPQLALSVRLNIDDFVPGGLTPEESTEICKSLETAGTDVIHCSCGTYESGLKSIEPVSYQEGWRFYLAEEVKKHVKIPVISGGMLSSPAFADQLVAGNQADFVFLARSLLADGEWPNKAREGRVDDIRPCIRCNNCIEKNFKGLAVDCTVNPAAGRERHFFQQFKNICSGKTAVVVGGGPAGMQAALSLNKLGLDVALYEKAEKLGGLLNLAAIPPHKFRAGMLQDYLIRQLRQSGVKILLNTAYDLECLKDQNPDYLIIAAGSKPARLNIKGWNPDYCLEIQDVLGKRINIKNKDVVIAGGGRNGCETADFLLAGDNRITIVEKNDILAAGMEKKNRRDLMNRLDQGNVVKKTSSKVTEIKKGQVLISGKNGTNEVVPVDYVVLAIGYVPCNDLFFEARKILNNTFLIGDAFEVNNIKNALLMGQKVSEIIRSSCSFA